MLSSLSRLINSGAARLGTEREKAANSTLNPSHRPRRGRDASDSYLESVATFAEHCLALERHLQSPDQAALHHGTSRTDIPSRLESIAMTLVAESTSADDEVLGGMGPCMEHLQKKEVLSHLVSAAVRDTPQGVLIEAVKFFQTLVANLSANFLNQQAVNKPLVRLIRHCVGDEDVDSAWGEEAAFEDLDEQKAQLRISRADADRLDMTLVGLMAFIASKLYNAQELLQVFFHDRRKDAVSETRRTAGTLVDEAQRAPSPALSSSSSAATVKAVDHSADPPVPQDTMAELASQSYDFPLFTYLLRFVHAEGDTGQLARAGLSVIVKIAFETRPIEVSDQPRSASRRVRFTREADDTLASPDLAEYVLHSDFIDVIGASLGAVYGLLPSKLAVLRGPLPDADVGDRKTSAISTDGMSLGPKDVNALRHEVDGLKSQHIEFSYESHILQRLQLFVDILDFLQNDVLEVAVATSLNPSDGRATLAQELIVRLGTCIRLSLMNNIIAPSMVESGDRDGSAVAVMSYLEVLLSAVRDESPLAEYIVGWLVQDEEEFPSSGSLPKPSHGSENNGRRTRRKSAALTLLEQDKPQTGPLFDPLLHYTIKNLIVDNLGPTTSRRTVAAALGLANVFLFKHGRFAPHGLMEVLADPLATEFPYALPRRSTNNKSALDRADGTERLRSSPTDQDPGRSDISHLQHLDDIGLYFGLLGFFESPTDSGRGQQFASSTRFENHLQDAETALASDNAFQFGARSSCSQEPAVGNIDLWQRGQSQYPAAASTSLHVPFRHRLQGRDPLLRSVLALFRRFFENSADVNIPLTTLLSTLMMSPYRNIDGWLTTPPSHEAEMSSTQPILYTILSCLVDQISNFQAQIPGFDRFLVERRKGLLYVENLTDALGGAASSPAGGDEASEVSGSLAMVAAELCVKASTRANAVGEAGQTVGRSQSDESGRPDLLVLDARAQQSTPQANASGNTDGASSHETSRPSKNDLDRRLLARQTPDAASLDKSDVSLTDTTQRASTIHRLFGRSTKARHGATAPGRPNRSRSEEETENDFAVPFADHYAQTESITFVPTFVPLPKSLQTSHAQPKRGAGADSNGHSKVSTAGRLSQTEPPRQKRTRFQISAPQTGRSGVPSSLGAELEAMDAEGPSPSGASRDEETTLFAYPGLDDDEQEESRRTRNRVTLSCLLDNLVILEEFIKQLVAVIQARRNMGVERIDFSASPR
ncbi:unnamed protein product [Parajaminaea phylloscopi]